MSCAASSVSDHCHTHTSVTRAGLIVSIITSLRILRKHSFLGGTSSTRSLRRSVSCSCHGAPVDCAASHRKTSALKHNDELNGLLRNAYAVGILTSGPEHLFSDATDDLLRSRPRHSRRTPRSSWNYHCPPAEHTLARLLTRRRAV